MKAIVHCVVPEKNRYPPHGRSLEIPRGRGVLKAKYLEEKYRNKLEFPGGRGGGAEQKTFCGGSMDIFWNCTLYSYFSFLVQWLFLKALHKPTILCLAKPP